ncbi:aromatic amino acid transaminase [Elstera cyanobacteriorum]|uniref:amino acid aminotransferase n=1 Tax=Elstera cyanobacteriorum TaxID=2022747 RepID=UPI0023533AD8|nr:amino acid aminotransferase [Elstera cyanobacteriorum]MCK6442880.1 aspartate/tyrosine/aromatic aminotransferase [Elstera cyanobacteriorum]
MTEAASSLFGNVEAFAGDPILSLNIAFQGDPRTEKVNLTIGIYMDGNGKVPVLPSVKAAAEKLGFGVRSYIPMEGLADYRRLVQELVFGKGSKLLAEKRVATMQSLGGTGALSIAADFLAKHTPSRPVYVSDPTWDNHHGLFQRAGFETKTYPYWDGATRTLRFDDMMKTLEEAPAGSIVIVQPVCHNPTGVDLSPAQQDALSDLLIAKQHIPVFDMAYQGFADGIEEDASFVRRYAERASSFLVANSFSKNFSLYGERVGGLSVVCATADEADRVLGQLKLAVRRSYSNPPTTGAQIVATVLGDPALRALWEAEVAEMRVRMKAMREALAAEVKKLSNEIDVGFITQQRGMFSYTGLSKAQVVQMRDTDGVYLVESGRMCVAGLTENNVAAVAKSLVAARGA